ncbi:hypothetical protein ACWF94_05440 [Streptomyces sp. NPDC055078]
MMPVSIADRTEVQVTAALSLVDVGGLTGSERMVALYASDMPTRFRFRKGDGGRVSGWIVQGVGRLGLAELRERALFARGQRLLELSGVVTVAVQALHERRFPDARRLLRAAETAALNIWHDGMTDAARTRNGAAEVDGGCPCRGTGLIDLWQDDDAPVGMTCPVHRRAEIRTFRARYGACR